MVGETNVDTAGPDDATVIDLTDGAPDMWADEYRTPEFLAEAIRSLRSEYGDASEPFGVYFVDGLDPRSSLGRAVELERFGESFENDVDLLRTLYGGFEAVGATELICVVDHEELRPAGVIRLVRNTREAGCRILNDLQADGENGWGLTWEEILERSDFAATDPTDILDIPTIAVATAYSGASRADSVSKALFGAVLRRALMGDAVTWVCSLERIPYILVQAAGRDVMHEFDGVEAKAYYGAPDTVPLWANFREYEVGLRRDFPESWAWLVGNEGLEQYFFGYPEGKFSYEPLDGAVIDLRRYEPVVPESR